MAQDLKGDLNPEKMLRIFVFSPRVILPIKCVKPTKNIGPRMRENSDDMSMKTGLGTAYGSNGSLKIDGSDDTKQNRNVAGKIMWIFLNRVRNVFPNILDTDRSGVITDFFNITFSQR